jgi:hypothetical protein
LAFTTGFCAYQSNRLLELQAACAITPRNSRDEIRAESDASQTPRVSAAFERDYVHWAVDRSGSFLPSIYG